MTNIDWLDPWWPTASYDEDYHTRFQRELENEVGPTHPLYRTDARLVGRGNGDDALFQLLDGTGRFAVVHLTWSSHPEPMPWPATEIYASLDDFANNRMIPEHSGDQR